MEELIDFPTVPISPQNAIISNTSHQNLSSPISSQDLSVELQSLSNQFNLGGIGWSNGDGWLINPDLSSDSLINDSSVLLGGSNYFQSLLSNPHVDPTLNPDPFIGLSNLQIPMSISSPTSMQSPSTSSDFHLDNSLGGDLLPGVKPKRKYTKSAQPRVKSVVKPPPPPQDKEADKEEELNNVAREEDKRRRNTAASARFRIRKKEREAALEVSAKKLQSKVAELEKEVSALRLENRWLRDLITEKSRTDSSSSQSKESDKKQV